MRTAPGAWFPRRGEVCHVQLDKDRPALVISSDVLNRHSLDVCIVPITSVEHRRFALRILLAAGEGGLHRPSWVKCDQVTTIERRELKYPPLGRLSSATLAKIEAAIKLALDLK
ncbi:MAG TPA: type II toxin-antitoxin system PemK/MazF family toxin [Terriglobales bacterium]|nr:type II toxin-antitoxin system PemK/MazF family toxin [Terriglobales bacterium]